MAIAIVSSDNVRAALGVTSKTWSELITHANINKWSKCKPVIALTQAGWPQADDYKYGLNLALGVNPNKWDYLKPRGGADYNEPLRSGDFKGYEPNTALTWPPCYCKSSDQNENPVLSPAQSPGGTSSGSAVGKFFNGASAVRINCSDIGLQNHYFGILVTTPNNQKWIKTVSTTIGASNEVYGDSIVYSAALINPSSPTSTYQNLPYGVGVFNIKYIISPVRYSDWTQNPTANIIYMPEGSLSGLTFKNSFNFTVRDWVYADKSSMSWSYAAESAADYVETVVYMSEDTNFTVNLSEASFLEYQVFAQDGVTRLLNSSLWSSGCKLRLFPIHANGGDQRNGTVYVNGTNTEPYPISVTQQASVARVNVYAGNVNVLTISDARGYVGSGLYIEFTPHYVPGGVQHYDVCWLIKVNGQEAYSSDTTGVAVDNDVHENIQSINFGNAQWQNGDYIDVFLYYEAAPLLT